MHYTCMVWSWDCCMYMYMYIKYTCTCTCKHLAFHNKNNNDGCCYTCTCTCRSSCIHSSKSSWNFGSICQSFGAHHLWRDPSQVSIAFNSSCPNSLFDMRVHYLVSDYMYSVHVRLCTVHVHINITCACTCTCTCVSHVQCNCAIFLPVVNSSRSIRPSTTSLSVSQTTSVVQLDSGTSWRNAVALGYIIC